MDEREEVDVMKVLILKMKMLLVMFENFKTRRRIKKLSEDAN